jgi:hypothetical protein
MNHLTIAAEGTEVAENKQRGYGQGSIRKLSDNRFQVSFYDHQGRRRRESFPTEAKAQRALTRMLALRDAGKLDAQESRSTPWRRATKPTRRTPSRSPTGGLSWCGVFIWNRSSGA